MNNGSKGKDWRAKGREGFELSKLWWLHLPSLSRTIVTGALIGGGVYLIVRGLRVHEEVDVQIGDGAIGAVRAAVVTLNEEKKTTIIFYRTLAVWLVAGGSSLVSAGTMLAILSLME